ncbi:MAG: glycosyltransferase [Planctomycetota bacterium]|jgi:glycosyltransferase involved in cell wall biosynthesis
MKVRSGYNGGLFRLDKPKKYTGQRVVRSSVSVVIPFGSVDYLQPLSNCLRSVRWQDHVNHDDIEIILVYLHKTVEDDRQEEMRKLHSLVEEFNVRLIDAQKSYDHFPLCLGRNIGARASKKDTLVFIDADAVLDPEFIVRAVVQRHVLVTCWLSYLGEGHVELSKKSLVRQLAPKGEIRKAAYGGGIVAPRSAVETIRGFDEVYDRAWGGDDNDMIDRLVEFGLGWHNLTLFENIANLHQYHSRTIDKNAPGVIANRKRYGTLKTVVRNADDWGII